MSTVPVSFTVTGGDSGQSVPTAVNVECPSPGIVIGPGTITVPAGCFSLVVDFIVSLNLIGVVQPGAGAGAVPLQQVGLRVTYDGNALDNRCLVGNTQVSRSIDRHMQVGSFQFAALDNVSPMGNPINAIYGGLRPITIGFEYKAPDGSTFTEPALTDGIVDDASRDLWPIPIDNVQVVDRGKIISKVPVTYKVPAGSGINRGALAQRLAQLAGETRLNINGTFGSRQKTIDLADGDWLAEAQTNVEIDGARLLWDRRGDLVAKFDNPEQGQLPVNWVFGPEDIIVSANGQDIEFGVEIPNDPFTEIKLRGNEQILRGAGCGSVSIPLHSELETVFANVSQPFQQQGGGSLVVVASPYTNPPATLQKTVEIDTDVTKECEEVIATHTITQRFYNPITPRYSRNVVNPTRPIQTYFSCWIDSNVDNAIGRAFSHRQFMVTEETIYTRQYDSQSELIGEITERFGFHAQKLAHKFRADTSIAWDTVNGVSAATNDRGDGMFINDVEQFQLVERVTTTFDNEDGYVKSRQEVREGFGRRVGALYLYGDGEWGDDVESFQELSTQLETWEAIDDSLVQYSRIRTDIDPSKEESEPGTLQIGSPPAAARKSDAPVDVADFTDPADAALAQAASRFEQREIRATCTVTGLDTVRPKNVLPDAYYEAAENVNELIALCKRIGLFGIASRVIWNLPINVLVEEGDRARITAYRGSGIDHDVTVAEVLHIVRPDGVKLTRCLGIAYPDPNSITVN